MLCFCLKTYNLLINIIQQVNYQKQMATQRIKTPQMIDQPYLRAANEITQLQIKDTRLHSAILNLKDKIQNKCKDVACKNCKIFQDQIVLLKNQQKDKVVLFQQTIDRLQIQKRNLSNEIMQLESRERQILNYQQLIQTSNKKEEHAYYVKDSLNSQKVNLRQIQDKSLSLKIKEKRESQILKQLKHRQQSSNKETATGKKIIILEELTNASILQPDLYLEVNKLEQKCLYFENLSKSLQLEIKEKNKEKEDDSMRIINLLDEVQIHKKQLQKMDRFYQNQCAKLQQEKQRIVYELTTKIRINQSQLQNLRIFIQKINKEKDNLTEVIRVKDTSTFDLKRQNEQLKLYLAQLKSQLNTLTQEKASKSSHNAQLSQNLSIMQEENLSLSYKLAQQTHINIQTAKKCSILQQQLTSLKKKYFTLQSNKFKQNQAKVQIEYLNKFIQQNKLISQSRQQNLKEVNLQLSILKKENQDLNNCIKGQFATIQRAEKFSSLQNEQIKTLQREKIELSHTVESILVERQMMEQSLKKQADFKTQYCQKYANEAEKYASLNKKYHKLEKQLQDYKNSKVNYVKTNELDILSLQLQKLSYQKDHLQEQINREKQLQKNYQAQIFSLQQQKDNILNSKLSTQNDLQLKQKQIEHFISLTNKMHNENENFRNQNTLLINKIKEVESILYQIQQDNIDLNIKNQQRQKQKETLQQMVKKLQQAKKDHAEHLQDQNQVLITVERQMMQLKMENIQKQRQNQTQRQSKLFLINHKKELQALIEALSQQNNRLKSRAQDLQLYAKQFNNIQQGQLKQLTTQLKQLQLEKTNNEQRYNQLESDYIKLQQQHEKKLMKLQKISQAQMRANENIIYLNQKIENMAKVYESGTEGKNNQQLIRQLNNKKQTITQLLANFKYIEKALIKKESEFDRLTQEYQKYVKQTQRQTIQFTQRISQREKQITTLKRQKEQQSRQSLTKLKDMEKQFHALQDDFKQKQKLHQDDKRQVQKQMAKSNQEKRKFEQSSTREIMNLKQSLQTQKKKSLQSSLNSIPVKIDDSKRKQVDSLKKTLQENTIKINQLQKNLNEKSIQLSRLQQIKEKHQLKIQQFNQLLNEADIHLDLKQHELQQISIKNNQLAQEINQLKEQLTKKNLQLEKMRQQIITKERQHVLMQESIKNIEAKYHQLSKENTEKSLTYDLLWMQLDESNKRVKILERQLNDYQSSKRLNSLHSDYEQIKQDIEILQHKNIPLPQLPLLNIRQVQSFVEFETQHQNNHTQINLQLQVKQASIEQIPAASSQQIQYLAQIFKKQEYVDNIKSNILQAQVKQVKKKSKNSGKNLLFDNNLSDILSDSEQNDKIVEMISNKESDHRSHIESSIEAFSQYSKAKSTKSELNHKQIQDQYKNKMKNNKMLAKLGKSSKKK